jgi:Bardet-Biedl syndrome 5 protein
MLTTTTKQRFEFIFTDFGANQAHFSSIFEIYKIYQATTLYRELKLRGAILTDGQLNILKQEQVYKQLNGIYNLSSDQVSSLFFIRMLKSTSLYCCQAFSNFQTWPFVFLLCFC